MCVGKWRGHPDAMFAIPGRQDVLGLAEARNEMGVTATPSPSPVYWRKRHSVSYAVVLTGKRNELIADCETPGRWPAIHSIIRGFSIFMT